MSNVTRFAPSPTGYLHLGHAYSALFASNASGGDRFILRIEDIDPARCRPEYTLAIFEDLRWLGLTWPQPVRRQSEHLDDYKAALDKLSGMGLLYPCFCTRREIEQEVVRAAAAPHSEDSLIPYPGTCRHLSMSERAERLAEVGTTNWRLDCAAALKLTGSLFWYDRNKGQIAAKAELFGDVVLARKDVPTSYHISVTVDDHIQGVTLVTRGEDLFASTHIHRLLQALLGCDTPEYHHRALQVDAAGRRFAKRDNSVTLRALRARGIEPEEVRAKVGPFTAT